MVVWLTSIQYLHVLVVQRSLVTVARPSQASHDDAICEYRGMFAIFRQWRTGHTCVQNQVAREVSMTPGPGAVSGCCCNGIHRCGRYPVSIDLSAEEGKKEPTF